MKLRLPFFVRGHAHKAINASNRQGSLQVRARPRLRARQARKMPDGYVYHLANIRARNVQRICSLITSDGFRQPCASTPSYVGWREIMRNRLRSAADRLDGNEGPASGTLVYMGLDGNAGERSQRGRNRQRSTGMG